MNFSFSRFFPCLLNTLDILYANKKRVEEEKKDVWWTPYSLTSLNTDKTNPRIPINDAFEVFLELVRRRLATHEHIVIDNKPFPVFMMMPGKDDEWKKLICLCT